MKKILLAMVGIIGFTYIICAEYEVRADSNTEIQVYFEGEQLTFDDTDPIMIDGRTMVPFRKIFETLGFEVEWNTETDPKAIGLKDQLTIELTIDQNIAKVNDESIELDVPAQLYNGRTLVPLRFVSENSGYHVYFSNETGRAIVGIGHTADLANPGITQPTPAPMPSSGEDEAYVVKGHIVNSQGQPLAGAKVFASNTFLYNSNVIGHSDERGEYRLELPEIINFSYLMSAVYELVHNGHDYSFDMSAIPDEHVTVTTGAVRDFELNINVGEVHAIAWDHQFTYPEDENAPWLEMKDVELTLKPIGQRVDGTTGNTIISHLPVYSDKGIEQVAIGTYEISAIWKPQDYKEVPLLVSLRDKEQFAQSVIADFETPIWSAGGYFEIQLDVTFP